MSESSQRRNRFRKFLRLAVFFLLILMVGGYCGGNFLLYRQFYQPIQTPICCETPGDWGFDFQEVAFTGGDNLTLRGWYIPTQNGVVIILLHGYGGNRLSIASVARMFAEAGYGILVYDMRGHGESDGEQRSVGWLDVPDVHGAVDFLHTFPDVHQIGIWGHSIGGQVAVRAAAENADIQAVIIDGVSAAFYDDVDSLASSSLSWRLRSYDLAFMNQVSSVWLDTPIPDGIKASLPDIAPRPIFLIGGTANNVERILIRDFYDTALEPKTLWEIPEAGHGGTWKARPEAYRERVIQFFDDALLSNGDGVSR